MSMSTKENDTKRLAFVQAGKCLVQTLLLHHPKVSALKITETLDTTSSSVLDVSLLEKDTSLELHKQGFSKNEASFLQNRRFCTHASTTVELETLLIELYAGKASELLFCQSSKQTIIKQLPLFDYKKVSLYTKQCKERIRVIDNRSYKHRPGKAKLSYREVETVFKSAKPKANPSYHFYSSCFTSQNNFSRGEYDSVLSPLDYFVFKDCLKHTKINLLLFQSELGSLERVKATFLVKDLCFDHSIYSPNLFDLQEKCKVVHLNKLEISDTKILSLFNTLKEQVRKAFLQEVSKSSFFSEDKPLNNSNSYSTYLYNRKESRTKRIDLLSQKKEIGAWCEEKVLQTLLFSKKSYGHWFRIYLPQIETHQRQPVSRDQFFKTRPELEVSLFSADHMESITIPTYTSREFTSTVIAKKEKAKVKASEVAAPLSLGREQRDGVCGLSQEFSYGVCHAVTVSALSQALSVIGKNRELLDILTDHLIRFGKIRVPDLLRICTLYVNVQFSV